MQCAGVYNNTSTSVQYSFCFRLFYFVAFNLFLERWRSWSDCKWCRAFVFFGSKAPWTSCCSHRLQIHHVVEGQGERGGGRGGGHGHGGREQGGGQLQELYQEQNRAHRGQDKDQIQSLNTSEKSVYPAVIIIK